MRKILPLYLSLTLAFIFQQNSNLRAQKLKPAISAAINSVEAQLGDPEWDSWGYVKNNFNQFGDIRNKSFSLSIIPKYFIRNDVLLRLELGITNIHLTNYFDNDPHKSINPPSSHTVINQYIKQKIYRLTPGIQWNFMRKKFIESYSGVTLSYLHYSGMKYRNHFEQRDLATDAFISGFEDNAEATGGFAAGIGSFVGLNFYIGKHFSLGPEASFSFLYYKIGNKFSGMSTQINNPSSSQAYSFSPTGYRGFQFSKILPSFHLSVWF